MIRFVSEKDIFDKWGGGADLKYSFEYLYKNKDTIISEMDEYYSVYISAFEKPYPEAMRFNPETFKSAHPDNIFLDLWSPANYHEAASRYTTAETKGKGAIIATALQSYKSKNNIYPTSLANLAPEILQVVPNDPFTDEPFKYISGTRASLWSVGPNMTDNNGRFVFDPKKGATSAGDIVIF